MMKGEGSAGDFAHDNKLRERLDFAQWVLDHMEKMSDVQAQGDMKSYERMLTTLIFRLSPWWPKGFDEEFKEVRAKIHKSPQNKLNFERIEGKELLLAKLLDETGIAFTRRKKAKISGGLKRLWEEFPPYLPNKEE